MIFKWFWMIFTWFGMVVGAFPHFWYWGTYAGVLKDEKHVWWKNTKFLETFFLKETGLIKIQTQIRVVKIRITSVRIFCLRQMSKINFIRRRFIICSCSAFSQIFREIGFGRFGPLKNHLDISLGAFWSQFRPLSFIKNQFRTGFSSKNIKIKKIWQNLK